MMMKCVTRYLLLRKNAASWVGAVVRKLKWNSQHVFKKCWLRFTKHYIYVTENFRVRLNIRDPEHLRGMKCDFFFHVPYDNVYALSRRCLQDPTQKKQYFEHYYQKFLRTTTHSTVPWIFPGIKAVGAQDWQPYHLHVPYQLSQNPGSLNLLKPSGPI